MKLFLTAKVRTGSAVMLAVAATAGCSYTSPYQTEKPMSLADGVPLDLPGLQLRNLAVISGEKGGEGVLTGTAVNTGSANLTLQIAFADGSQPVTTKITAGQVVLLGEGAAKTKLKAVPAPPGAMAEMSLATSASDVTPISVPVLPPIGYYEDFAPPGYTPPEQESEEEEEE